MPSKEIKKQWRDNIKKDTEIIEGILHPTLEINEVRILHEHLRNGRIRFTAWIKDNPINNGKQYVVKREDIITRPDFYKLYENDMVWLSKP